MAGGEGVENEAKLAPELKSTVADRDGRDTSKLSN